MLYEQVMSVTDSLHTDEIIERMWSLAAQLERIQQMERIDRQHEAEEMILLEKALLAIDDDKPTQLGARG